MNESITWVGMDVHKASIAVAILRGDATRPEIITIKNEVKCIKRMAKRLLSTGDEVRACYEAGPCGYALWRQLEQLDIVCDVIAPALIPQKPGERIKTDRRDAANLAMLFRAGVLTSIRVPTTDQEALRDLVRAREDARREVRSSRHRLSKFLLRHGRIFSNGKNWTKRHWKWVQSQTFVHRAAQLTFEDYVAHLRYLIQRLDELDTKLFAIANEAPYSETVNRLRCLRGIDTLTAVTLVAEIQDFRRFQTARQFAAFVGLVPSEYSSGETEKRGKITKTGNAHARRVLIEASWHYRHAVTYSKRVAKRAEGQPAPIALHAHKAQRRLNARYRRLVGRGKRPQVAVVAVARELAAFVWAIGSDRPMKEAT